MKNIVNIAPSPAIPVIAKGWDAKNVEDYKPGRLQDHVLFRFQPTHIIKMRKQDYSPSQVQQLEDWWAGLNLLDVRDNPFVHDSSGLVIIWTFCGGDDADPDNGVYGDDCE